MLLNLMSGEEKDESEIDDVLQSLTEDQRKLLFQAIEHVKHHVFNDVVRQFRNYLLVAASLVTLFGVISVKNLRSSISDAVAGHLARDPGLKEMIRQDASVKAGNLITDLESVVEDAKKKALEDNVLFGNSARELNELLESIIKDREKGAPRSK